MNTTTLLTLTFIIILLVGTSAIVCVILQASLLNEYYGDFDGRFDMLRSIRFEEKTESQSPTYSDPQVVQEEQFNYKQYGFYALDSGIDVIDNFSRSVPDYILKNLIGSYDIYRQVVAYTIRNIYPNADGLNYLIEIWVAKDPAEKMYAKVYSLMFIHIPGSQKYNLINESYIGEVHEQALKLPPNQSSSSASSSMIASSAVPY